MTWSLGLAIGVLVTAATAPWLCVGSSDGSSSCVSVVGLDLSLLVPGGYGATRVVAILLGVLAGLAVTMLLRRRQTP